jgi:hypothetical protein
MLEVLQDELSKAGFGQSQFNASIRKRDFLDVEAVPRGLAPEGMALRIDIDGIPSV